MCEVRDILLNRVEIESFTKSFVLFFSLLELLIAVIFYMEYKQDINKLDYEVLNEMKVCSFNLKCPKYEIDFQEKQDKHIYTLYKENELLYSYFNIPDSTKYHLKIMLTAQNYKNTINDLSFERIKQFSLISIIVLFITIIFSLYSMNPLRTAFKLSKEFIKDILHDFNTPISSIMLNIKTLQKSKVNYDKIHRIEQSLNTLLSLQDNLRNYLFKSSQEKTTFDVYDLVKQRVDEIKPLYANINFTVQGQKLEISTNKTSITRIIDNLISNASKYNKKNGSVNISIENNKLIISDTGMGIKNPNKVFDRFYKEHRRGLGIGLHIVKKLCKELRIDIKVKSEMGVGSSLTISF